MTANSTNFVTLGTILVLSLPIILYASNKGIFKYNDEKNEFENDPILSNSFLENDEFVSGRLVFDDKTNTLWGFTNKSIIHFSHGKIDNTFRVWTFFCFQKWYKNSYINS